MRQYKLTFLDKLAFILTVQDFESANDITALAHAYTLCGMHMIEVTHAGRRVGEITKGWPVGASVEVLAGIGNQFAPMATSQRS